MNVELFLARRILKDDGERSVSTPIVKIAVVGIALGLCVMLLAVFILTGFKHEITRKLSGFTAHINLQPYPSLVPDTDWRVTSSDSVTALLRTVPGVARAYAYTEKPAILKRGEDIHAVILRGMDNSYDPSFYQEHLKRGSYPDFMTEKTSNDMLISISVASYLHIDQGDKINVFFVQEGARARALIAEGVYNTGFKEYDDRMVVVDMRHLTKLNNWDAGDASGIAVLLDDLGRLDEMRNRLADVLLEAGYDYNLVTVREQAPQIFDWLNLINMNVWVILVLIVLVAGFNMVSGLLILILDKTRLIGLMKAFGYRNISLRKMFLYISVGLIGRGMLWGNIFALLIGGLQYLFHIVRLDPGSYFMDTVPIYMNLWHIVLLNIGVVLLTLVMLIVPTMLISRIDPIKSIKFD